MLTMNDDLQHELENGQLLAAALVEHMNLMGSASEATIPVIVEDEKWEVTVRHKPVTC